jgi:hypothetical protein
MDLAECEYVKNAFKLLKGYNVEECHVRSTKPF